MTSQKEKKRMMDFTLSCLEDSGENLVPCSKSIHNKKTNYIKVGDDGVVLLVDKIFRGKNFDKIYSEAMRDFSRVGTLFFKDGKTYFRNAAKDNYFRQERGLSLKNYTNKEMNKMIMFRPEEKIVYDEIYTESLQYYQPESERLEEKIATFRFKPVTFDYTHIHPSERFGPAHEKSKRLRVWDKRIERDEDLELSKKYLLPIDKKA